MPARRSANDSSPRHEDAQKAYISRFKRGAFPRFDIAYESLTEQVSGRQSAA